MRAVVIHGLALMLILGITGQADQASAERNPAPLIYAGSGEKANRGESWRWETCRFRNLNGGPTFGRVELELIVRCANRHWPVPGGASKIGDIIDCESGWGQFAVSPGGHLGLLQFAPSTFASVMSRWPRLWARWNVAHNALNARSNILAGVRKMAADGFGAWSCA